MPIPHFMHSFISWWYLCDFRSMALMENAAVSMNIQVFVERGFSFLLGVDLGVAVLGQMVTLCLRF